jgi:hypothetical protein
VTRLTESHEIALIIASAFGERTNVVNLLGGSEPTLFLTLLTERVRLDVAITDTLPGTTISLIGSGVTFVLVVVFVHNLLMFGTVLLAFSKPTAAGVGTGTFRFVGHQIPPFTEITTPIMKSNSTRSLQALL